MLMLYISCTTFGVVLNVFNLAANMGLHAARGVKPFQANIIVAIVALFILNIGSVALTLYAPGEISDAAFTGAAVVAIISIWFFAKTYRTLSQEYFSKKDKDDPSSFADYWTAADQREEEE